MTVLEPGPTPTVSQPKPPAPSKSVLRKQRPHVALKASSHADALAPHIDIDEPPPEIAAPDPLAGTETPGTSVEPTVALAAKPDVPAEPATPPTKSDDDKTHYHVSPPPSVELQYDVQKVSHEGNPIYGRGKIAWHIDGDHYVINGEAGMLFITALSFKSEGVIDEFGVAPVLYSEKRFRRSETNTHFHRERNTISFSASTQTYPRQGGEQDRASIIWQLVGIGRGDSAKFAPDAEFDMFVAGVRDGEVWRLEVVGEEEIDTGGVKTKAWHVMRMPRAGSYDQKLDIWLAPQAGWYPIKIRYTENNGDYLDMSVSNLKLADLHVDQSH